MQRLGGAGLGGLFGRLDRTRYVQPGAAVTRERTKTIASKWQSRAATGFQADAFDLDLGSRTSASAPRGPAPTAPEPVIQVAAAPPAPGPGSGLTALQHLLAGNRVRVARHPGRRRSSVACAYVTRVLHPFVISARAEPMPPARRPGMKTVFQATWRCTGPNATWAEGRRSLAATSYRPRTRPARHQRPRRQSSVAPPLRFWPGGYTYGWSVASWRDRITVGIRRPEWAAKLAKISSH